MKALIQKIHLKLDKYHDKMYSNWKILALLVPIFFEYVLSNTVHFADTVMVAYVSENAVSGVGLAGKFSAVLTTFLGGFSIAANIMMTQYIGRNDHESASKTVKQAIVICYMLAIPISLVFLFFSPFIIGFFYPNIAPDTFSAALTTMRMSGLNILLTPINLCLSKVFISQGMPKISLIINIVANVVNVTGNSIFIYFCQLGVFGASLATFISTLATTLMYFIFLKNPKNRIRIDDFKDFIPTKENFKRILGLGAPTGFENNLSYLAKFFVAILAAQCSQIALNADTVAHELSNYFVMGGCALGNVINIVIGHCAGAGRLEDVKYFSKKLTFWSFIFQLVFGSLMIIFIDPLTGLYGLSVETAALTKQLIIPYIIFGIPFWTLSYTVPNCFRACGDVKYTMAIATLSLWVCRVGFAYLLFYFANLGIWSLWIASYIDWGLRSVCNVIRFKSMKWTRKKVI